MVRLEVMSQLSGRTIWEMLLLVVCLFLDISKLLGLLTFYSLCKCFFGTFLSRSTKVEDIGYTDLVRMKTMDAVICVSVKLTVKAKHEKTRSNYFGKFWNVRKFSLFNVLLEFMVILSVK